MFDAAIVLLIIAVAGVYVVRRLIIKRSCCGSDCHCSTKPQDKKTSGPFEQGSCCSKTK